MTLVFLRFNQRGALEGRTISPQKSEPVLIDIESLKFPIALPS